jgi:hypothetical protein
MEARSQLRHRPTKEGTSFILLEHAYSVKRSARGNYFLKVVIGGKNVNIVQALPSRFLSPIDSE